MVVAANPGSDLTAAPELDLVKAALLYGDEVTLLSPVTTMLLRVENLEKFSPSQQLALMRRVAPILMAEDDVPEFERSLDEISGYLRASARGASLGDVLLRAGLREQFKPMQRQLSEAVRDICTRAGVDQLARARASGLLDIESADPGDAFDLLVSCIRSAKLAESGEREDDPHTNRIIDSFVGKLSRHLSSGREYLIFDEPIANLTSAAISEGLFSPAKGPAGRCAQAMTASALMGRLPTFPLATVDEVLDIRKDLAPSLTRFRGAMVTIAKGFASSAWESDFEDEVHDAWVETVAPAIEQIGASVQQNHSLLSFAADVVRAGKDAYPGLTVVAAGLLGHAHTVAALGGAFTVAAPVLQALRDHRDAASEVRMQPFYFLYAAERSLS